MRLDLIWDLCIIGTETWDKCKHQEDTEPSAVGKLSHQYQFGDEPILSNLMGGQYKSTLLIFWTLYLTVKFIRGNITGELP